LKDLVELVATFNAGQPPSKKWWISIAVTPFDAEPLGFTTGDTKHQLNVSHDPFITRVTVCIKGDDTYDDAWDKTFAALLARLEKKHNVKYRLDRAHVMGSPAPLKKAVTAWLATVRDEAPPPNTFEAIAVAKGAKEKTVARWARMLDGGAGYELELDGFMKLLDDDTFVHAAREWLDGVREIPRHSKKGYKRLSRVMCLLARGDTKSRAVAQRFLARAKKSSEAASYTVDFGVATRSR
jgi:hypothetical protein